MVRQHHQLNEHEFEQTLEDNEGQGSLVCCNPQCCKESDMTTFIIFKNIIHSFGCPGSYVGHRGSSVSGETGRTLVAVCEVLVVESAVQFPDQGSNPGSLHWKFGISAIGPPRKSLMWVFLIYFFNCFMVSISRSNIISNTIITCK